MNRVFKRNRLPFLKHCLRISVLLLLSFPLSSQCKLNIGFHHSGAYYFEKEKYKTNNISALLGINIEYQYRKIKFYIDGDAIVSNYRRTGKNKWYDKTIQGMLPNSTMEKTSESIGITSGYNLKLTTTSTFDFLIGLKYRLYSNSIFLIQDDNGWGESTIQNTEYANTMGLCGGIKFNKSVSKRLSFYIGTQYIRYLDSTKYKNWGIGLFLPDPQRNTLLSQIGFNYTIFKMN